MLQYYYVLAYMSTPRGHAMDIDQVTGGRQ